MNKDILKNDEKAVYALRTLFRQYGYLPFKMSKFEEYDLYVKNKDFLVSDKVITFSDTNGKLMALKPDVTLSIIKNGEDEPGCKQKVYYNENVYRVSGSTHQFKELMQAGVECIGDVDCYDTVEVISLAAKSLELISPDYVLEICHLGIIEALLDACTDDSRLKSEMTSLIAEKNVHDLKKLCADNGIAESASDDLCRLAGLYGDMNSVIERLIPLCTTDAAKAALDELCELKSHLTSAGLDKKIRFDFSVVNDMNYYNGTVFCGFVSGICESVLAGGRYDRLLTRMGRRAGAIGFAIYLDLLEELDRVSTENDVDVLILYDESDIAEAHACANALLAEGKSVSVQKAIPKKLRYGSMTDLRKGAK
ncbi:MAG: ATP phosphoribosyltransferase regulatory subunit [Clostridia bacterium]|nr:ATP phosphoribosyltransferase regulatory subunit [Clostridia bacterium]